MKDFKWWQLFLILTALIAIAKWITVGIVAKAAIENQESV